jgi:hypothetical protein
MSQLSRDLENSARKRHLSFSQVLDLPEENSSDNSESESESGSQKKPKTPFGTLLCGIDSLSMSETGVATLGGSFGLSDRLKALRKCSFKGGI